MLSVISAGKAAELAIKLFSTPQNTFKEPLTRIFEESEKLNFIQDGNTITGYRWNQGGRSKILIIHGYSSSVVKFEHFILPLVGKGYEVLAFDAPAHGYSSGKTLTAVAFKNMIRTIHEKFGPVNSFMAHSFGGLAVCLAMEEMQHDENIKIVLIAPATESIFAMEFFFNFLKLNEAVQEEFKKEVIRISQKPIEWFSVSRAVKNIKAKILWCHDEGDRITPYKDAKKVKDIDYPNIEFLVTTGLGHRRIYRDKKVVNTIINFL
jgi:pimeloyl-ACP methyl ester carboxylesterase